MIADEELGLEEPLIPPKGQEQNDSEPPAEADGDAGIVDQISAGKEAIETTIVWSFAAAACAASVLAMVAAPVTIVFVAGGICCLNAPTVVYRRKNIASLPKLRASTNALRDEANRLTETVDVLSSAVNKLDNKCDGLKTKEEEFERIVQEQGSNANELIELVKENQEILEAMQVNLRRTFVSTVIDIVMRADKSGDGKIDLKEGHMLALSLQTALHPHGIELDTDMFFAMLEEDNDVAHIVRFCAEVLNPHNRPKASEEGESEDAVNDRGLSGEGTESMSRSGSFGGKDALAGAIRMITISDKYTCGSIAASRGRRVSLVGEVRKIRDSSDIGNILSETKKRISAVGLSAETKKKISALKLSGKSLFH